MKPPLIIDKCSGTGELTCNDCKQSFALTGFLHGTYENRKTWKSYQCLKCGKLEELEFTAQNQPALSCACGGMLCREHQAFCPACKSKNVVYHCLFLS